MWVPPISSYTLEPKEGFSRNSYLSPEGMVMSIELVPVSVLVKAAPSSGKPNRNPTEGKPLSRLKCMFVPLFVQINELSERPIFKSSPALPGRPTIGTPQLKLRESRSSLDVPTRFLWSMSAISQLSTCSDSGAGADGVTFDAIVAESGGAILGVVGVIER